MKRNLSRSEIRKGGGRGTGEDHLHEVVGSSEFEIFLPPNKQVKGYVDLKRVIEALGCEVEYPAHSRQSPGPRFSTIKITYGGRVAPPEVIRQAHQWAHHRNLLHSFFRPLFEGRPRETPSP